MNRISPNLGKCRACSSPATKQFQLPAGTVVVMCDDHASPLIEFGWNGGKVSVLKAKPPRSSVGPREERGPVIDLFGALAGKPLPPGTKVPRVLPPSDEVPF